MKLIKGLLTAALLVPSLASAVVYNIDITYDGVSQSLDPGSDAVAGLPLNPGDGFLLDLHADSRGFWEVTNGASWNATIYAAFQMQPGDNRTYNSTATFFNNGAPVHVDTDLNAIQSLIHAGAQQTILADGLKFDQLVVDYTYLAGANSTFASDLLVFSFLGNPNLANYRVPEPTTLALFGLALVGLGFARKQLT